MYMLKACTCIYANSYLTPYKLLSGVSHKLRKVCKCLTTWRVSGSISVDACNRPQRFIPVQPTPKSYPFSHIDEASILTPGSITKNSATNQRTAYRLGTELVWSGGGLLCINEASILMLVVARAYHVCLCKARIMLPSPVLKPRGDIIRSPKQGHQWPHKKGIMSPDNVVDA